MSALKNLGSLDIIGGQQRRVLCRTTYADFMAMTSITRDYIAETGNADDLSALDRYPDNTLLYYVNAHDVTSVKPVPQDRIRYASAKDKRATLKAESVAKDARILARQEQRAQEIEQATAARLLRIAQKLYAFDRHNEIWDDAMDSVRNMYIDRAKEIVSVY